MQNQSSGSVRLIDRLRNAGTDEGTAESVGMKAHERLALELKRQQQEALDKEKNRIKETPEVTDSDFGPTARERLAGLRRETEVTVPSKEVSDIPKEGDSIAYVVNRNKQAGSSDAEVEFLPDETDEMSRIETDDSRPTWQSGFPTNDDWDAEEREMSDQLRSPQPSRSFSPELSIPSHPGNPHVFTPPTDESGGIEKPLEFAKKQVDMQNWLQRSHLIGDGSSFFERNEMKIYGASIVLIALLMYWVMSTL